MAAVSSAAFLRGVELPSQIPIRDPIIVLALLESRNQYQLRNISIECLGTQEGEIGFWSFGYIQGDIPM